VEQRSRNCCVGCELARRLKVSETSETFSRRQALKAPVVDRRETEAIEWFRATWACPSASPNGGRTFGRAQPTRRVAHRPWI
jgi:hypothetical protein